MNKDNKIPSPFAVCVLPYLIVLGAATFAVLILGVVFIFLFLMGMAAFAASCLMSNILFVASVCLLLLGLYIIVPLLEAWTKTMLRKCWTSQLMREYRIISFWIVGLLAATIFVCWAGETLAPGKDQQRIMQFSGKAKIDISGGNSAKIRGNMQISINEDGQ